MIFITSRLTISDPASQGSVDIRLADWGTLTGSEALRVSDRLKSHMRIRFSPPVGHILTGLNKISTSQAVWH